MTTNILSLRKRKIIQAVIVFCIGSLMYGLIEVITRGYTHWTMLLTGGAVFLILYFLNLAMKTRNFVLRGLIGCAIITLSEFIVGVIVNIIFSMNVWDYSDRPGNVLGQICPKFSLYWFMLSIVSIYLSVFLYWQLNKKMDLHQKSD